MLDPDLGDPASYSNSKSYGTLVGDIYHGWFDPDAPAWVLLRLCVMVGLMILGIWLGLKLQQRLLRNYLHLKMFGYDDGTNPPVYEKDESGETKIPKILVEGRDPLSDQDGAFFCVFAVTGMTWYVGLRIYNAFLTACGASDRHHTDAGMHGLTFAGYNLILAGLLAWACDWYTLIAITDQMLQTIHNGGDSKGFQAYASDPDSKEVDRFKRWAHWWDKRRVVLTRVLLVVGWPPVLICCKIFESVCPMHAMLPRRRLPCFSSCGFTHCLLSVRVVRAQIWSTSSTSSGSSVAKRKKESPWARASGAPRATTNLLGWPRPQSWRS